MRVLVVGGTGFIGSPLVRALRSAGHDVAVLRRGRTSGDPPADVRTIPGDRRDLGAVRAELEGFRPEVVVDVIPFRAADARDLMDAFRGIAGRVVALSSADVYRNYDGLRRIGAAAPDPPPLAETAPLRENLFPYRDQASGPDDMRFHYEKILVERAVLGDPDLAGTVLRLPMVYGPGDGQHRLHPYLKRMDDRRPAILLGEGQAGWRWTRGYVENVAGAIAAAVTDARAAGQVYNIGEVEALTEAEWVAAIARAAGWSGTIRQVPDAELPPAMREDLDWRYSLVLDTGRLRAELGYAESVGPEEALRRTIDWERAHPPGQAPPDAFDYAAEDAVLARAG